MWLSRTISAIDWFNMMLIMSIASISLLFIYSATTTLTHPLSIYFIKQLIGIGIGIIIYILFRFFDYRTLCRWSYFFFMATIILLVFTIIKGHIGMGAQRWIDLKFFKIQPSELAKLFLPAFIVYYLQGEQESKKWTLHNFTVPIFIILISFVLILKQPDLGTALIILITGFLLLWYAGLSKKFFIYGALICTLSAPLFYKFLKPYQRKRIEVFLGAGDQQRERYHVEQSKIAIGSGGCLGKGLLQGTQNRFAFLPERRTDFIFSVLCEEWGFLGAVLLLFLYSIFMYRILLLINTIGSFFARLLALGLLLPIMLSIIINVGMVIGLLPVVGIPLPLMSYGLSHTLITYAALGWISNIIRNQHSKSSMW